MKQKILSIQILTHNCAEHIVKCIKSLTPIMGFVNDIVVVDDESTDKTLSILNLLKDRYNYPITIIEHKKGIGGFSEQRNIGISAAKGNWVLILDSDETVHSDIYWELLQLTQDDNILAYYFPRVLLFPDENNYLVDAYPDYQMRLFRRIDGIKFTRVVHEYLIYVDKDKKIYSLGINQSNTKITNKVIFFHYQLLASKEKLEEKGKRWSKLSNESRQVGFEIIGKDAYKFNTYQHRIIPLSSELKQGMVK